VDVKFTVMYNDDTIATSGFETMSEAETFAKSERDRLAQPTRVVKLTEICYYAPPYRPK
jgi:hypothetical protein